MNKNEMKSLFMAEIPHDFEMTVFEKQQILQRAKRKQKKVWIKPTILTAVFACIIMVTGIPLFQYIAREQALSSFVEDESIIPVTLEDVSYPRLINSTYISETNELIFTDGFQFFSHNLSTGEKMALTRRAGADLYFNYAANDSWLIWDNPHNSSLSILNRKTGEVKEMDNTYVAGISIHKNKATFIQMSGEDIEYPTDVILDLQTMNKTIIPSNEFSEGTNSLAIIKDDLFITSEKNNENVDILTYNLRNHNQVQKYTVPFDTVTYMLYDREKIFGLFSNGDEATVGYIDLLTGNFVKLANMPAYAMAVYGDYLALSVEKNASDTVKLYQIHTNSLKPLKTLNIFSERLVKPRFTTDGKLIVNGENKQHTMYVIDIGEIMQ